MISMRVYENGSWPCINVKCYACFSWIDFKKKYKCDDRTAKQACEVIEEDAISKFWRFMQLKVKELFGEDAKVIQLGRSGGWLSVSTLKNRTSVADYEDEEREGNGANIIVTAEEQFDEDQAKMAELENFSREIIHKFAQLNHWSNFITRNKLYSGWRCSKCGTFHEAQTEV